MRQILSPAPTPAEIEDGLRSCEGLYCQFQYVCQTPPRDGPKAKEQMADTKAHAPHKMVKGFIEGDKAKGIEPFPATKAGVNLQIRPMTRRKKLATGTGYFSRYGMIQGQNLWRQYRLTGIVPKTVKVNCGGRMIKVFPNA